MKKWICILLIVTVCFTGLALGFTYGLIQKHTAAPPNSGGENTPPAHRGIDLYGTYDENDLNYTDASVSYKGTNITIPHIEGLKDKTVEESINSQIENKIYGMLDSLDTVNYASGTLSGNFANVISIQFSAGHDNGYERLFLNYDLVTGQELRLSDLFYEDTDILSLVREAFYNELSLRDYNYGEAVSPDENQLYKIVKAYMESDTPDFAFSPAQVYFYSGDHTAEAAFLDIPAEVAIYERFLTETSIFADDNIGFDNIFTCADATQYRNFEYLDYGTRGENLWYDVSIMGFWLPTGITDEQKAAVDRSTESLFEEIYADIDGWEQKAKENPDKYYILLYKPSYNVPSINRLVNNAWVYDISNAMETAWNLDVYEVPMEQYESRYRDELIAAYRYNYFFMAGGAWLDRNEGEADPNVYTHVENMRLMNLRTGDELTLETVFREGADWQFTVRNEITNRLINGWTGEVYSSNEAIDLAQTAEIYLSGMNVRAKIPAIPDFDLWYSLTQFPKDMLTIFD